MLPVPRYVHLIHAPCRTLHSLEQVSFSVPIANYLILALLLRISDENNRERGGGTIVALQFD